MGLQCHCTLSYPPSLSYIFIRMSALHANLLELPRQNGYEVVIESLGILVTSQSGDHGAAEGEGREVQE